MNTNAVLRFLDWAALTYIWLDANCLFFTAIADEEAKELLKENDKDKSEDEGEVVETETETVTEETVTKTFPKS